MKIALCRLFWQSERAIVADLYDAPPCEKRQRGPNRHGAGGPGFIAKHFIDVVRRLGFVNVVAIAGRTDESAEAKAALLQVDSGYGSYRALLQDDCTQVVHNPTPSDLRFEVTRTALYAGKHIISDKPLAITPAECAGLSDLARQPKLANVAPSTIAATRLCSNCAA